MNGPFKGIAIAVLISGVILGGIYLARKKPPPVPIPIEYATLPLTATYQGVVDSGEPLSKGWYVPGSDSSIVADFAAHDYFIQPPTPLDDEGQMGRKDLLVALRKANPKLKLIAQVTAGHWPMSAPDTLTYYGDFRVQLDRAKAFVPYGDPGVVDMANPLAVKTCVRVWTKWALRKPWDGMFIDVFQGVPPDEGKFAQAGFGSRAEYRDAWRAGWLTLAGELRANAPKGFLLMGNFGPPDSTMGTIFDSWMMENWPFQSGGFAMMEKARRWYTGPMVIFTAGYPGGFTGADSARNIAKDDYGRACAALFDAIHVFQPPDAVTTHAQLWWTWRRPKWELGAQLGPAAPDSANVWRRDFERGQVWANPSTKRGGVTFAGPS